MGWGPYEMDVLSPDALARDVVSDYHSGRGWCWTIVHFQRLTSIRLSGGPCTTSAACFPVFPSTCGCSFSVKQATLGLILIWYGIYCHFDIVFLRLSIKSSSILSSLSYSIIHSPLSSHSMAGICQIWCPWCAQIPSSDVPIRQSGKSFTESDADRVDLKT